VKAAEGLPASMGATSGMISNARRARDFQPFLHREAALDFALKGYGS
jgi:hypothetical protein